MAKVEHRSLHLEKILERELGKNSKELTFSGSSSPLLIAQLLSQTLSKKINALPHVVVLPSHSDCEFFEQALQFFEPHFRCHILPHFDVSPYSSLEPRGQISAERIAWLHRAQNARPGEIFVASVGALQQKTLPFEVLSHHTQNFKKNDELPTNFSQRLTSLGYAAVPLVEDVGQFAIRGGIVDVFSPAHPHPLRFELFGDTIDSIRFFSPVDQRSLEETTQATIVPPREILFSEERLEKILTRTRASLQGRDLDKGESDELLRALVLKQAPTSFDFLLPFFYESLHSPLEHFSTHVHVWILDPLEISRKSDLLLEELKSDFAGAAKHVIRPPVDALYETFEQLKFPEDSIRLSFSKVELAGKNSDEPSLFYGTYSPTELSGITQTYPVGTEPWFVQFGEKLRKWKEEHYKVFIAARNQTQSERLKVVLEKMQFEVVLAHNDEYLWAEWDSHQHNNPNLIHIIPRSLNESLRFSEENLYFLRDEDFFGKKQRARATTASQDFQKQAKRLSFGDLKPGDAVVHIKHGIGIYDGLKVMNIGGADSEFIQVSYKDKDKLYLPVYRVGQLQKYSSGVANVSVDKLGGQLWEKTKTKVKGYLRDLASELLKLYAARAEVVRPALPQPDNDFLSFESAFPYDETDDQLKAINDIIKDFTRPQPMDRLICGDVGFGKTEVAMRAAFKMVQAHKQVAVLAPTTVLTFQHGETFKKRFQGWPVTIKVLNRFVPNADAKKIIQETKDGKVDILIGTHRLLSKDVAFKDLGLLIVDEEQKFGVTHKEKIRKLRVDLDTLTLSATPIPRTLNMSLNGVRDLSLINTPPMDRLPTRTFVCKFDEETIRKSITSELARGGQVFFIHNRIEGLYALADEIRQIVPEARIKAAHGQMDEHELEQVMLAFFNHEIDVLVCTTIVESGMDIPKANTMFIDRADMLGLSQLYQLRGRVGRSKQRAYCYLLLPRSKKLDKEAQERLRVIQENSALGSGIRIAQYDLELRGAGNILGEEQSGHINAVGYELYMELLGEALAAAKGEVVDDIEIDPEINLKVPALIPDSYIPDIRLRLSYYKALADVKDHADLESIEEELKDQFGQPPEPVMNLMGLMLIRSICKTLAIRDLSAGLKTVSLVFTDKTPLKPETVIALATRENKKYSITPDQRLNIRMNNITWPQVYEELIYLTKLV